MLKLNIGKQQSITIYNASQSDLEPGRRLIVPVTNPDADFTLLVQRVWELANAAGSRVQFIGLSSDAKQEASFRRTLATMSAMVNNGNVSAESEVHLGRSLVDVVKSCVRDGDMVVCWQKQQADLLQTNLNVPIYYIPEVDPKSKQRSNWLTKVVAWSGSIAIIVGFFFMQVAFDHFVRTWAIILQLISVAGEFGSIWFWNNLFG